MTGLSPRALVVELIKTLEEAESCYNPGNGDGGPLLMPSLYSEGSYSELERRLDEMRDSVQWRRAWWNLTQRYLVGAVVSVDVGYRRTIKGPHPLLPGRSELLFVESMLGNRLMRIRVYRWDNRVEDAYVEVGLARLLATMYDGETQRIHLPLEFLYRALGKELPHGTTKADQPSESIVPTQAFATS